MTARAVACDRHVRFCAITPSAVALCCFLPEQSCNMLDILSVPDLATRGEVAGAQDHGPCMPNTAAER